MIEEKGKKIGFHWGSTHEKLNQLVAIQDLRDIIKNGKLRFHYLQSANLSHKKKIKKMRMTLLISITEYNLDFLTLKIMRM